MIEWLGWLSETIQTIGDLIPRRILVKPNEFGIKYKNMTETLILRPGIHWYCPFFTKIELEPSGFQTLYLGSQDITTSDGAILRIKSSIIFVVKDFKKAKTEYNCYITQIDDDAKNVVCRYLNTLKKEFIVKNVGLINKRITRRVGLILETYGIQLVRYQLTSLATGIPLIHIYDNNNE